MSSNSSAVASAPDTSLPPFTQEDILALIGWREEGREVLSWLEAKLFTRPGVGSVDYELIARHILDFWKEFNSAPGDHLYDLVLQPLQEKDRAQWMEILNGLKALAPGLNVLYISSRLQHFLHQADLRTRIYSALQKMQQGEVEEAETVLTKTSVVAEQPTSLTLKSMAELTNYLAVKEESRFLSGIPDLDRMHVGPGRKELMIVMAPPKRGKSWWLIHIAKFALMSRARVLHVTLEMRREQVLQRYVQSLTGTAKRPLDAERHTTLIKDEYNTVNRFEFEQLGKRAGLILQAGKLNPVVLKRVLKLAERMELKIEEFPMRSLTVDGLKARLDTLERKEKFIPDMLIVDYGDLFKVNAANLRIEIGAVFQDLRGIGQERNMAVVTATQGNRGSSKAKLVTDFDVSEDFSKIMTADWVMTYSQSRAEKKLGLARLFTTAGRDEVDKQMVVVSQSYPTGQFCLDSARLPDDWDKILLPYDTGEGDANHQ